MPTKTTTNVSTLKINYLTQAMYDAALAGGEINEDELYFTPDDTLDKFYPVGSYYETSDTTFNPNTAWGGTWVEVEALTKNGSIVDEQVSIINYNSSSNRYTIPKDGLVRITAGSAQANSIFAQIYNSDDTNVWYAATASASSVGMATNTTTLIPVFKGQKLQITKNGTSTSTSAVFYPYGSANKRWHRIA